MADRILKFLSNLLKTGKEQLLLKSGFLRSKVPIKPALGLTGLGVLLLAVRPMFSNNNNAIQTQVDSKKVPSDVKPEIAEEYDVQKTLYLMKEKEKQLRKQDASRQKS